MTIAPLRNDSAENCNGGRGSSSLVSAVVTRYNIRVNYSKEQSGQVNLDEEWLEHRKALFDEYCLPTMRAQSYKNFIWFVLFDPDTPKMYYDYIQDVATPIFSRSARDANRLIDELLQGFDYCVSTRLDNDDGLAVDYLQAAYDAAEASAKFMALPHIINFRSGAEIDVKSGKIFARDYASSSFLSVVSSRAVGEFVQAHNVHHVAAFKELESLNILTHRPMWLITIHDRNVGNTIKGADELPRADVASRFALER